MRRRKMLKRLALALVLYLPASMASAATLGDDGLHKEEWFSITFRDIKEDIDAAAAEGKRLAIIIEQRGCIYCKKVHEEILSERQRLKAQTLRRRACQNRGEPLREEELIRPSTIRECVH